MYGYMDAYQWGIDLHQLRSLGSHRCLLTASVYAVTAGGPTGAHCRFEAGVRGATRYGYIECYLPCNYAKLLGMWLHATDKR